MAAGRMRGNGKPRCRAYFTHVDGVFRRSKHDLFMLPLCEWLRVLLPAFSPVAAEESGTGAIRPKVRLTPHGLGQYFDKGGRFSYFLMHRLLQLSNSLQAQYRLQPGNSTPYCSIISTAARADVHGSIRVAACAVVASLYVPQQRDIARLATESAWVKNDKPMARLTFPTARAERIARLRAECEVYSADLEGAPRADFEAEVRFERRYARPSPRAVADCSSVLWAQVRRDSGITARRGEKTSSYSECNLSWSGVDLHVNEHCKHSLYM